MDLMYAVQRITGHMPLKLWHKNPTVENCDFVLVPGGFSYGDYLRSGAIAALSPVMDAVRDFAAKGGPVLGICNGFQILCEAGLLPGALVKNTNRRFLCTNTFITPQNQSAITALTTPGKAYNIPIAHSEGRYYADNETLKELNENDRVIFRYCNERGEITPESNPNGSLENIAGICNEGRNVFGMMPHPERAADVMLGNTDGISLLKGFLENSAVGV